MAVDSPWSDRLTLGPLPGDNHAPTAAVVEDQLHVVWKGESSLFHSILTKSGWSQPMRVAAGEQPAMVADANDSLHCVFTNWLGGNADIFYTRFEKGSWSPPLAVSRTPGLSVQPALAIGPNGTLHAAWADTTPGRPVIYYGFPHGRIWLNSPVPNGQGSRPTLAVGSGGEVYLAWQDRATSRGPFDVYSSVLAGGKWSLPENVSDGADGHSIHPRLATDSGGSCQILWQEESSGLFVIRHCDRRGNAWSAQSTVSTPNVDCRQPMIVANALRHFQAVWLEGAEIRHRVRPPEAEGAWGSVESVGSSQPVVSELATAVSVDGELHVVSSAYGRSDSRQIHHLQRQPLFRHKVFLPAA